uniref:Uncharacterized protein n=1 Tax=uncultured Caudovirales phage TaxID=2100421 RepID=A0A6J5LAH3_9CAUD|nr:hypothetical protein UFOVP114_87 [uncultured Caudovirales phage]
MSTQETQAARIGQRLHLPVKADPVARELYDVYSPVLDTKAAAARFTAYWSKAYGVHTLTPDLVRVGLDEMALRVDRLAAAA